MFAQANENVRPLKMGKNSQQSPIQVQASAKPVIDPHPISNV